MLEAQRLLESEGLLRLHVDLKALADTREIVIEPMETSSEGVSGMLVRYGNSFGILYDNTIPSDGFQRFSIAHELGHFFVEGHLDHIPFVDGAHRSRAGYISENRYEREADCFAAGLLMPEKPVRDVIAQHPNGLAGIEAVGRDARASLTASAIRYVGLTDAAAAVIVSRNGKVDYCFMSDAMKSLRFDAWPRKSSPIPVGTATASVARLPPEQRRSAREEDETSIVEWLGAGRSARAREEVVGLGSYERVLTVLTCPDLLDEGFMDEDDDSDEVLEESWTPRFRGARAPRPAHFSSTTEPRAHLHPGRGGEEISGAFPQTVYSYSTCRSKTMLAIRLPSDIEERLERLAKATGRTKTYYAREAILEHLDDLEDLYLAEQRLIDNRAGRSQTYTLEEVERELGLVD